jgi:hypothetical protein
VHYESCHFWDLLIHCSIGDIEILANTLQGKYFQEEAEI